MPPQDTSNPARRSAMVGLAVVGFIALIALGIWLAVSSARYVPGAVGGLGSAATYLGSIFTPAPNPSLSVVPTASTTPFSEASTTPAAATSTAATTTETSSTKPKTKHTAY